MDIMVDIMVDQNIHQFGKGKISVFKRNFVLWKEQKIRYLTRYFYK